MKRSGLLVGLALGTATLLAATACAPRDGGTAGGGSAPVDQTQLVAALPAGTQPVDRVTWSVVEGEPATLDPGASANLIIPNLCDNLLSLQPDFTIEPGVAERAEFVDPVTFVIDLRDDVRFWDGSPVTADDVVYSLQRGQNPQSQWYGAFALVQSIEQTGERQVTVRFTAPDLDFRNAIAGQGGAVMSRAFGDEAGPALGSSDAGLMCTGPFVLEPGGWTPGRAIEVVANDDYWGDAPLVQELEFVFVTDSSTLATALTQGEIDGAYNVSPSSRSAFEGEGAGSLVLGPSTASYSFGPATAEGPAANPTFRAALSATIDREQYIDTVLGGLGEVQKTMVPPFSFSSLEAADIYRAGYDALETPGRDLERARELLEESGEPLDRPLVIAIPAGAKEFQQTATILQSSAQEIGVDIEIEELQPADFGAMFYDPAGREGIDFVSTQGYLEVPGVTGYPSLFMLPAETGGVFNWSGYDDERVTAHMQAARTAPDVETAAEEFVAAQEIFTPDQLQVTLAGAYQTTYLNDELSGAVTSIAIYSSPWALHLGGK